MGKRKNGKVFFGVFIACFCMKNIFPFSHFSLFPSSYTNIFPSNRY
jgi:hypothetical protein